MEKKKYSFRDNNHQYPTYAIEGEILPRTPKQFKQIQAFSELSIVRGQILLDNGYPEDWEPKRTETFFYIELDTRNGSTMIEQSTNRFIHGLTPKFPTLKMALTIWEQNIEIFKTFLGI